MNMYWKCNLWNIIQVKNFVQITSLNHQENGPKMFPAEKIAMRGGGYMSILYERGYLQI